MASKSRKQPKKAVRKDTSNIERLLLSDSSTKELYTEFVTKQKELIDFLGISMNTVMDDLSVVGEEYNKRVTELQMIQAEIKKATHGHSTTVN